jgi:hypothetical protein
MMSFDVSSAEARAFPSASSIDRFLFFAVTAMTLVWLLSMALTTPEIVQKHAALLADARVGWWVLALFAGIICWGFIDILFLIVVVRQRYTHGGRGPVKVEVGVEGLRFAWAKGPPRLEPWQGVNTPIVIRDFSDAGYQAQIKVARYTSFAVTGEAANGVISVAMRLGLQCSVSSTSGSTGAKGTLTVIRRAARASELKRVEHSTA